MATEWTIEGFLAAGAAVGDDVVAAAGAAVRPSDRMVIVHTSGSTSEPKGVIHQHGTLVRHIDNLNELRRYTEDDVLFSNSPFFWIGGFAYGLLGTLLAGATLVCSNATDPSTTLDLIERVRPTMVNGFAASVAHLAKDPTFPRRDLSSIRRGNLWPIMPDDVRPADPELRHNMLGMTETGSVCLATDDESDQPEHRRGSFGRPVPGFEARIVDPDTGADCETGQVGELWFRGPFLMEGYYGRERHETFTPDGWYRTGDLFHVDDEGFFYFTGRKGDMIKTAGANVVAARGRSRDRGCHRSGRPRARHRGRRSRPAGRGRAPRAARAGAARHRRAARRAASTAVGLQGAQGASSCSRTTRCR